MADYWKFKTEIAAANPDYRYIGVFEMSYKTFIYYRDLAIDKAH
jgi:hypothetical protein